MAADPTPAPRIPPNDLDRLAPDAKRRGIRRSKVVRGAIASTCDEGRRSAADRPVTAAPSTAARDSAGYDTDDLRRVLDDLWADYAPAMAPLRAEWDAQTAETAHWLDELWAERIEQTPLRARFDRATADARLPLNELIAHTRPVRGRGFGRRDHRFAKDRFRGRSSQQHERTLRMVSPDRGSVEGGR